MRPFKLLLLPMALALSGCAGSVFFGYKVAQKPAATTAPAPPSSSVAAPDSRAPQSAPAAPSAPTAPAAASDGAPAVATTPFGTSGYAAQMVNTVAVTFTPQAKEKVSADPRFREGALLTAVEGELRARNLLKDGDSRAGRTVDIQIDDFATRASTNAVVLGYKLGAGTLTGNVRVRDGKGNELQGFRIEAASRLTTAVNDENSNPLVSLYGRFAELTVDNLGGSPRKHDKAPANQMP